MAIDKRQIQEVNAGSMADIAFLLLIFFLVATTMNTDSGIQRTLPQWIDIEDQTAPPVKERNLLEVKVSQYDQILAGGQYVEVYQLKDIAKDFYLNRANDENMPEKEMRSIDLIGEYPVSLGVISLQNARATSYDMYIKVQNELQRAINEIRNEVAVQKFGLTLKELNDDQVKAILLAVPTAISEAEPVNIGGN